MIELLRNSKDKRARKLAKKRVRNDCLFPQSLSKIPPTAYFGSFGFIQEFHREGNRLTLVAWNYSSGRLDVRSERSMSCKVSLLSQEGLDIRSRSSGARGLADAIIETCGCVWSNLPTSLMNNGDGEMQVLTF